MPSMNSRTLTLTPVEDSVTIRVTYNAVFSEFERFLAANGLWFRENIRVVGMDPAGSFTGSTLWHFRHDVVPVRAGEGSLTIARDRSLTVPRALLQEDPGLLDDDEIRCHIEITPIGMPERYSAFTPERTLLG